jgi:transposase-like protein
MWDLLTTVINAFLSAEADAVCVAEYGTSSPERVSSRNSYRHRDTRAAPSTSRSPNSARDQLPRVAARASQAGRGGADQRGRNLLTARGLRPSDRQAGAALGIASLSKLQVSRMAADLDEQVTAFRTRPLTESGPLTFLDADALTIKVRENGRVVNAVVLVATGVNADRHRKILGIKVATSETHTTWNGFFADLVARG